MKRCPECNRTYADETLAFCPADGALLSAPYVSEETQRLSPARQTDPPPTEVLPASFTESTLSKREGSRNIPFIVAGVIAVLIIAGLFIYLKTRPAPAPYTGPPQQHLEVAIRPGSPEFEQIKERLVVDEPEATEGGRVAGDIVMTLTTTVRNFTGRTITGLEMRAAVVDLSNKPIKERYVIVIPNAAKSLTELENNKTLPVSITIEGFSKSDVRANIQMEVAGVKFK
jgi:hypothetical protein